MLSHHILCYNLCSAHSSIKSLPYKRLHEIPRARGPQDLSKATWIRPESMPFRPSSPATERCSFVSGSLRPQGLYSPWNSPARTLEWVAFPFSRGCSQPRNQTPVSGTAGGFFTVWATREQNFSEGHFIQSSLTFSQWKNAFCISHTGLIWLLST